MTDGAVSPSRAASKSYRDLVAWQQAMDFVVAIYQEIERWPSHERYGLTQQLRRCAVSVASNIAEGQGRRSNREFSQFLRIALGSLQEAETQILIAARLGFCSNGTEESLLRQSASIGRLVQGLRRSIAATE